MGFQTLAIEQQAVEVGRVLGAVKTEFAKFGEVLDRVKWQLDTASGTIDEISVPRRAMERKLRAVEQLPEAESDLLLGLTGGDGVDDAAAAGGAEGRVEEAHADSAAAAEAVAHADPGEQVAEAAGDGTSTLRPDASRHRAYALSYARGGYR